METNSERSLSTLTLNMMMADAQETLGEIPLFLGFQSRGQHVAGSSLGRQGAQQGLVCPAEIAAPSQSQRDICRGWDVHCWSCSPDRSWTLWPGWMDTQVPKPCSRRGSWFMPGEEFTPGQFPWLGDGRAEADPLGIMMAKSLIVPFSLC